LSSQRVLFDSELYLLTLLSNIVEAHPLCIDELLAVNVQARVDELNISRYMTKLKLCNPETRFTFVDFLVSMLLKESLVLLKDFAETDKSMIKLSNISVETANIATPAHADRLPVSEIIISAHICLLLVAIVFQREEGQGISTDDLKAAVKAELPRCSWWLPVRVLKAFLALQGQVRSFSLK